MSSQDDVRKLAELRQRLQEKINGLEEEIDLLKQALSLVDEELKKGSFVKATAVPMAASPAEARPQVEEVKATVESETRPLRRQKDGYLIANAYVEPGVVTIVPVSDVVLRSTTPPFKSYLMGKVLAGMRARDEELLAQGKTSKDRLITFEYEEDAGKITKLVVRNYNDRVRLNEILNTTTWTFTKMLEKQQ
jgi:hypothetical protein